MPDRATGAATVRPGRPADGSDLPGIRLWSPRFCSHVPVSLVCPRAVARGVLGATGNLWDLTERLHVDLERTASSVCRP